MAQVSLPYTLTAGTPENVNNLVANLNALVAGINTVDTAQLASGSVTTAKIADANVTSAKLAAAPFAELTQSATAIGNSGFTGVNYTTTSYDNGVATCGTALADLANDRIYLRRAGIWLLQAICTWAANGTGSRWMTIDTNGPRVATSTVIPYSGIITVENSPAGIVYVSGTSDYAFNTVWQNSGGNLNGTATFRATWLGNYS